MGKISLEEVKLAMNWRAGTHCFIIERDARLSKVTLLLFEVFQVTKS
jgi:hypothetical protein